jgi:hypothetical protein
VAQLGLHLAHPTEREGDVAVPLPGFPPSIRI